MAGHNGFELELHGLFQEGLTLDVLLKEILTKYEKSDALSPSEAESISHFFTMVGRQDLLFKFFARCLRKNAIGLFPWGSFAEALAQHEPDLLDDNSLDLIDFGLASQPQEESSIKSIQLQIHLPQVYKKKADLDKSFDVQKLKLKDKLMAQLNHNRLYQLVDQEEQTLQQLVKIFPNDIDVKLLQQAHLEKKADEILAKVKNPQTSSSYATRRFFSDDSAEVQQLQIKFREQLLDLCSRLVDDSVDHLYNLAVMCYQIEMYDLGLEVLNFAPESMARDWLASELLFESGRYLELLKYLEKVEKRPAANAETTYALIYLKAQAYKGLGQTEIALRLLESLAERVPDYRATQALIHEWKNS